MTRQQVRERVREGVEAIPPTHGDLESVLRQGRRRRFRNRGVRMLGAVAVVSAVLVGAMDIWPIPGDVVTDDRSIPTAPDMIVSVHEGDGPGPRAEDLMAEIFENQTDMAWTTGLRVVSGTAEHVGWIETEFGRFELVTFTSIGGELGDSDEPWSWSCLGVSSTDASFSEATCGRAGEFSETEPEYGKGDFYWTAHAGPDQTATALITTTENRTIEVVTSEFVFVPWPTWWGPPQSLTFIDDAGLSIGHLRYPDPDNSDDTTDIDTAAVPSQSPSEAERDGVVPALAELPFESRVEMLAQIESDEGTWMLARPTEELVDATMKDGCGLGDLNGTYPTEVICTVEYGEILLVNRSGEIVRAFPMPGAVPSWIHVDSTAVYAGRVGDGAQPDSTLVRIDRNSLKSTVVVLAASEEMDDQRLPEWHMAEITEGHFETMVRFGPAAEGTQVSSWKGDITVDLAAIDQLIDESAR